MRSWAWAPLPIVLAGLGWASCSAVAQQVTVATPYQSVGDSFFENMGTSWGVGGRNWFLNVFGSPNQAAPQFGGFDPSAGAGLGFGFGGGGLNGSFLGNFSQGSRRSFTSQTPSITLQNGYPGGIFDSSLSPFVVSYIPVVGGFPAFGSLVPVQPQPVYAADGSLAGGSVVQQALERARRDEHPGDAGDVGRIEVPRPQAVAAPQARARQGAAPAVVPVPQDEASGELAATRSSSADRPAVSVAEARRLCQAEQAGQDNEVLEYLERARGAEAADKSNVARIYYQMAERRAAGALRQEIEARLRALERDP
jgi:hypothetical protein